MLTRAELLIHLCYEIPCTKQDFFFIKTQEHAEFVFIQTAEHSMIESDSIHSKPLNFFFFKFQNEHFLWHQVYFKPLNNPITFDFDWTLVLKDEGRGRESLWNGRAGNAL